jgi:RimJ/RimL family protein N-acetyltransferase
VFRALETPRLVIRAALPADVDALVERRNDPQVARLQDWATPYSRTAAESTIADTVAMTDGPADGGWWMATLVETSSNQIIGDMSLHLTNNRRTAEVGYSLNSASWGNGYATEALMALLAWAFEALPITRVTGSMHPDNRASAMLLERAGLLFEGHTRLSYWLDDENSDDFIYGMTRAQWSQWRDRPANPPTAVRLVPVTVANKAAVLGLRTHHSQELFVAPVLQSFADALLPQVVDGAALKPWLRAIEADGELVGFVMLALPTPTSPEPILWRLLVDRLHQRRGVAIRALDRVAVECRAMGAQTLVTSWVEGRGSPRPFYLARGFIPTGGIVGGETEARLQLG